MCGISLIFHSSGTRPEKNQLLRMNKALAHRGPDDSGIAIRNNVGLGHTRLSIVDIAGGTQPLYSSNNRWCIVFNGEIYNYLALRDELKSTGIEFRTKTDTEVILQLYIKEGPKSIHRLRGMFAFVIHDLETGQVFIARDRVGIKPLYYHRNDTTLTAASEIKALFASGLVEPEFNHASIINYFKYQNSISPHTIFKDVYELPPGHTMAIEPGAEPVISEYWNIEFPIDGEYDIGDEKEWTQKFEDALADAVKSHTIGEVPIGAYLSGGIDSATMAWMLKNQYSENFKTFSIRFTNPDQDESALFRRISEHLKINNEEIELDDQRESGYLSELEQCIYHLEQPQRVAVDIPMYMLSNLVRNQDHKVVYTGDGADEILGGYDCYRMDYIRISGNQLDSDTPRKKYYASEFGEWLSSDSLNMVARLHEPENQKKVINKFGCYPAWHDTWHITEALLPDLFSNLLTDDSSADKAEQQMDDLAAQMKPHLEGRNILNQSLYIETKTRLPGWILLKSDRLSMAHSVEARVPFMDHPLIELTASIPPGLKLNGMNEKYVLKQVAMPNLPDLNTEFKKRAFYTPIREWFFTKERIPSLESYLSKTALQESNIFNPEQVKKLYQRLVDSKAPDDRDSYYRVLQLEWVMMLVLTVQILYSQFIKKRAPCFEKL